MSAKAANQAQVDYWNTSAGPVWVEFQERLDRQLDPLGLAASAALAVGAGEHVLDIGCGCGHTTLVLAGAVGSHGRVVGVDVSRPMLEIARRRAAANGAIEFLEGDAQTLDMRAEGGAEGFDAAYSRFGVMFFANPTAAFRNIRHAIRPGGRLGFVCWRALSENLWMRGPVEAAAPFLPPSAPPDPEAPGPFAFADGARVRRILEAAGWGGVEIRPHDVPIGAGGLEDTLTLMMRVGPLGAALREAPEAAPRVMDAVRGFLARHERPDGVRLPAAAWIVTAARG
ncbi:MAG TPA: class I SAM-dependent methyltransferase [Caulobacteraceae bacterium]|jgi:SAM-dependent methyltransferase|nr:class I SAM-dependent methyltransferase [Caulobacteraceae bacterium]